MLAGRSADQLRRLAERLNLEWQVVAVTDEPRLNHVVGSAALTLLVASP